MLLNITIHSFLGNSKFICIFVTLIHLIAIIMKKTITDREQECFYCIALSQIPHIGIRGGKKLYDSVGNATDIFKYRTSLRERIPELNSSISEWLNNSDALSRAEKEMEFIHKNNIDFYLISDADFPSRFRSCDDASLVLFSKGNFDMNVAHVINIVGTRRATDYGKQFCASFIKDLKALCPDVVIVSGLAYGIDIASHRAAVENDITTIGVLGHGLDRIYPASHRNTAINMLKNGGLLTEFISGTDPDRFNFVSRNRIIAGISDATIVVESASKGGSLITADIAESYHRDCFAVPGRLKDDYSIGCNQLIHDNKASVLLDAEDLVKAMRWEKIDKAKKEVIQRSFFPELNAEEQAIAKLLDERGNLQINILVVETGIPINRMNSLLFNLEMRGIIRTLAGGVYQLLK
jgi:DNA processing protein